MDTISVRTVSKSFGGTTVLDAVEFSAPAGSITAVLGRSGSGKTTLLRILAGLERVDTGVVRIDDAIVDDGQKFVHPQHRGIGYVPQDGALFPHLRVAANIGFGLPRSERTRVPDLVRLVGLSGLEHRFPHQLSGGQQQRVALARALAIEPKVILLDEPFSALDAGLRVTLREEVVGILRASGTTALIVTHDQDEAMAVADRIAILDAGRVVSEGAPRQLYQNPADAQSAQYLGTANILSATVTRGVVDSALGAIPARPADARADGSYVFMLRPEQLAIHRHPVGDCVPATVVSSSYRGDSSVTRVVVDSDPHCELVVLTDAHEEYAPGGRVHLRATSPAIGWAANPRTPR